MGISLIISAISYQTKAVARIAYRLWRWNCDQQVAGSMAATLWGSDP